MGIEQKYREALALLKKAGEAIDISVSQKHRALRFKIIKFLEAQNGH